MRVLHIADRWSHKGGADWHLVGVVQSSDADVLIAIGKSLYRKKVYLELVSKLEDSL